ncbi:hypothetical protein LRC74_004223, partial [Salmonella enterica]|nr:hypothetical protein [Salmonella enterica]
MPTINVIKEEAIKFRELIEKCDKNNNNVLTDSFPVMNCKISSILLSYHFLTLWPEIMIKGINAAAGKNGKITHYWLEINDVVVDITGDQYNLIDDRELNENIIQSRPFPAVHVSFKKESYLYKLFKIQGEDNFEKGFPTIGDDFIEEIHLGY